MDLLQENNKLPWQQYLTSSRPGYNLKEGNPSNILHITNKRPYISQILVDDDKLLYSLRSQGKKH